MGSTHLMSANCSNWCDTSLLLLTDPSRFKGLKFEGVGMGFELPKQLAVSNIAVRNFHTRYDHLSLLARMAHLRIHTPSYRSS